MPKEVFRRQVIISSVVTVLALAVILVFCVTMFQKYSPPNEDNTFVICGTVTEVYHAFPKGEVVISLSNGDSVRLVYPWGLQNLCEEIGYDIEQLADLLEGEDIKCRRMNDLPWAVEINAAHTQIDNSELTNDQMTVARVGISVLGVIMLAFVIGGDLMYLEPRYQRYLQETRKLSKKAKRALKKKEKKP